MKCPRCQNKGFKPSEEVKYPLFNMGNKEKYDGFDMRRYVCLQCGYKFLTVERFERPVMEEQKIDFGDENDRR